MDDPKKPKVPDEFVNPSGLSKVDCDTPDGDQEVEECDLEITAQVKDLFLEETLPGAGIPGYEGEEDGGG